MTLCKTLVNLYGPARELNFRGGERKRTSGRGIYKEMKLLGRDY
jgi:hypothetical protein